MVTSNNKRAKLQKRRAISTIVGGAIFLVLFVSALSTFFIAMDVQRDTINTQRTISESIMDKTKEQFSIAVSTDDSQNNLLGIQVKNQGTNPVEVGNIWIINKSGNQPAEKYLIDYRDSIIPPGYGSNILENTPLHLTVADDYDIKVVSTLGTVKKAEYTLGAANNLRAELIAIPPDVKVGQNVTLTMYVENVGMSRLLNVHPFNDYPNINLPFNPPDPPAPSSINLDPGEGVFFTWEYKTSGSAGSVVVFDSYATAQEKDTTYIKKSNVAVEKIQLREPDDSEITVLNQDLLAKPEIFLVVPSPFGAGEGSDEKGLWGINVVNPTGGDMYVSKITISVMSARSQSQDKIIDAGSGSGNCAPETVGVTPDFWSCPAMNQLMWKNIGSPQKIPKYSSFPFQAMVKPGSLATSSKNLENVVVVANVFTTLGEFGKAGYGSSTKNGDSGIVNVFLADEPWATDKNSIIANITKIPSGSTVKFNATLADFEKTANPTWTVDSSSRLIVNVPRDWTVIESSINTFGDYIHTFSTFDDQSSQIVGDLVSSFNGNDDLGKTIQFEAVAPTVSTTQLYVMYILADGKVTAPGEIDFAVGPLQEVILQVVP